MSALATASLQNTSRRMPAHSQHLDRALLQNQQHAQMGQARTQPQQPTMTNQAQIPSQQPSAQQQQALKDAQMRQQQQQQLRQQQLRQQEQIRQQQLLQKEQYQQMMLRQQQQQQQQQATTTSSGLTVKQISILAVAFALLAHPQVHSLLNSIIGSQLEILSESKGLSTTGVLVMAAIFGGGVFAVQMYAPHLLE